MIAYRERGKGANSGAWSNEPLNRHAAGCVHTGPVRVRRSSSPSSCPAWGSGGAAAAVTTCCRRFRFCCFKSSTCHQGKGGAEDMAARRIGGKSVRGIICTTMHTMPCRLLSTSGQPGRQAGGRRQAGNTAPDH